MNDVKNKVTNKSEVIRNSVMINRVWNVNKGANEAEGDFVGAFNSNNIYHITFKKGSSANEKFGESIYAYVNGIAEIKANGVHVSTTININCIVNVETQNVVIYDRKDELCIDNSDIESVEMMFITMRDSQGMDRYKDALRKANPNYAVYQISLVNNGKPYSVGLLDYELIHFFCVDQNGNTYNVNGYITDFDDVSQSLVMDTMFITKGKIKVGESKVTLSHIRGITKREIVVVPFVIPERNDTSYPEAQVVVPSEEVPSGNKKKSIKKSDTASSDTDKSAD